MSLQANLKIFTISCSNNWCCCFFVFRVSNAFRIAAQSLSRSQSALGGFYRRLRSRLGAAKAIIATAHKLARMFYRLWTTKKPYRDLGADYYDQKYQERMVNSLEKKTLSLGFKLVAKSG